MRKTVIAFMLLAATVVVAYRPYVDGHSIDDATESFTSTQESASANHMSTTVAPASSRGRMVSGQYAETAVSENHGVQNAAQLPPIVSKSLHDKLSGPGESVPTRSSRVIGPNQSGPTLGTMIIAEGSLGSPDVGLPPDATGQEFSDFLPDTLDSYGVGPAGEEPWQD